MKVFVSINGENPVPVSVVKDQTGFDVFVSDTKAEKTLSGKGSLVDGSMRVEFETLFVEEPIVNVTPIGCCNHLYISEIDESGFTVVEANGGRSNISMNWIAIGNETSTSTDVTFDYRIVAKRKGFEDYRLKEVYGAYSDHYLYPDINDVPMDMRSDWVGLLPVEDWKPEWLQYITPEQQTEYEQHLEEQEQAEQEKEEQEETTETQPAE